MKTAVFILGSDPFTPSLLTETQGVNMRLPFYARAIINLDAGESQILIRAEDYAFVSFETLRKDRIAENNIALTELENGDVVLSFTPNLTDVAILELDRSAPVDCSLLIGTIVPGLRIEGMRIAGEVGNIPAATTTAYRFAIRGAWNDMVSDIMVNWEAQPVESQISWNYEVLPAPSSSTDVPGRAFFTLGEFKRGQLVERIFDLHNPDATPFDIVLRPTGVVTESEDTFDGVLPIGLSFTNNPPMLAGFIPAEVVSGDYYFEAFTNEPDGPIPTVFHIRILASGFDKFSAVNRLTWVTDAELGTLDEGIASHIALRARNSAGGSVSYALAAGSRQLPTGLVLAPNGEIRGVAPHVPADTTFRFSVKATSGPFTATKTFEFQIKNSFIVPDFLTVSLPLSGPFRKLWAQSANNIDSTRRFRINDPLYADPNKMLLIRGLRNIDIPTIHFGKKFKLIVGPVKVAKAMIQGVHAYDVIYREFFDPMQKAGGFVASDSDVIESPAQYPQDTNVIIREATLNNLRKELTLDVGLNAPQAKQKKLGVNGGELLDPWMKTRQKDGKVLGYVGAMVVAYILPGQGTVIAGDVETSLIPIGSTVEFDRLYVEDNVVPFQRIFGSIGNSLSQLSKPATPLDLRIDGVPAQSTENNHPTPQISWQATQSGVTYRLEFYQAGNLVRTTTTSSTSFFYAPNLQAVDGNPSMITLKVFAVRASVNSIPAEATFVLFDGWGRSWGMRWGGTA